MNHKPPKCDACERRIRKNRHAIRLSDLTTGQVIGRYHARPLCQSAGSKYVARGVALRFSVVHPARCGEDFEECDGGLSEVNA